MKIYNNNNLFISIAVVGSLMLLTGCPNSVVFAGKQALTPAKYAREIVRYDREDRVVQQKYANVVKRLNKISKQCYQFDVTAKGGGKEVYKDKYTGKVTRLSKNSVIFTLQYDRVSGKDFVYTDNKKPDGGMWDYGIVFEKTSKTVTTAKLYVPYGLMKKRMMAVVDTLEGKYGDGCPPEELQF